MPDNPGWTLDPIEKAGYYYCRTLDGLNAGIQYLWLDADAKPSPAYFITSVRSWKGYRWSEPLPPTPPLNLTENMDNKHESC